MATPAGCESHLPLRPSTSTVLRNALNDTVEHAEASNLRPIVSLSHGIQAGRAAVVNGLTLPWSTGPVGDPVTKVKLFKRQGYGRASTRLLRRRIVSAA
jgi:transposase